MLPSVGFGLCGEPEFAGDVGRGAGQAAFCVKDPGLELAVGHAADDLGFVLYFQGADGGPAQVVEFGVAAARFGRDGLAGVGDPGGFPVDGRGRGPPGIVPTQQLQAARLIGDVSGTPESPEGAIGR